MEILNGSNTSENSGEELDESGFTISSDGMDMKSMAEKLQKMETELLSMKRVNGRLETVLLVMKKGNGQQQQTTTTTGEPSLIQMGWQMAEKFNKIEMEFTRMASKMTELEDKNRNLENEMGKIQEKNGKLEEEIGGFKEEINKLKEENIALSLKNRLNVDEPEPSIEITNLHDSIDENVHSRIESMENELKSVKKQISLNQLDAKKNINKLDWRDCGTAMNVLEGIGMALSLNYSGNVHKWNTVRAESAIQSNIKWEMLKKDSISVVNYFEMKIEKKPNGYGIRMGYADLEFPLEGVGLGDGNAGSIGLYGRGGICIGGMAPLHFETNSTARKKSYFREGDMAGCGLLYSAASQSLECFAACNGKLLGSFELPHKFIGLQLFPAISLCYPGQSIRANFGQDPFCYDPNQLVRG